MDDTTHIHYGALKWIGIFFISIIIGIAVAMALAGIIYGIRSKDPNNNMTFQKAVEKTLLTGIYFGFACVFLYILSNKYGYNLELIIMCAILLAGILATIGTSVPWQSIIGSGIVFIYVLFKWIYLLIKRYLVKKRNEMINKTKVKTE
jgi:glucose uptake protein GlcU